MEDGNRHHVAGVHRRGGIIPTSYTYRGWNVEFVYPPIPFRGCDWQATHSDYDGAEDANDNRMVHGSSRAEVQQEIDMWFEENEDKDAADNAFVTRCYVATFVIVVFILLPALAALFLRLKS